MKKLALPDRSGKRLLLAAFAVVCLGVGEPNGALAQSDEEIRHLLSRATFGPTWDAIDEVRELGINTWLREQVEPKEITDPELEEKLANHPSLSMSSAELLANYPQQSRDAPMGIGPPGRILGELRSAQIIRAVHAKAQLREVLTDFWFNHFNVFAPAGPTRYTIVPYVRDAIRPHVLGRFEDLLRATAESPAMLYYLDNATSSAPGTRGRNSGINENYARELLELHTVGVDGGYTQEDIIEVARAFTGWTFTPARLGTYEFFFRAATHEGGDKTVMGTTIPEGDRSEGDQILKLLAQHPKTAEFISRKLVQRFVADDPPASLVEKTKDVYLATDGNLAFVVAFILSSEEFYEPQYRGAKIKTPLEIIASSLRAMDADVIVGSPASRVPQDLGQTTMACVPPTGWPETANEFISAGGMVSRFETAYTLATGSIANIEYLPLDWRTILDFVGVEGLAQYLLVEPPTGATLAALSEARGAGASAPLLAALVLASPEFQQQ